MPLTLVCRGKSSFNLNQKKYHEVHYSRPCRSCPLFLRFQAKSSSSRSFRRLRDPCQISSTRDFNIPFRPVSALGGNRFFYGCSGPLSRHPGIWLQMRPCIPGSPWQHGGAGGAPVSTSDWRRWQHAGDDSLAPLTIGSKQTNANSNELALAA